ncbi:MAG: tetratricopeptide repeat protein [Opitutales bacterium]
MPEEKVNVIQDINVGWSIFDIGIDCMIDKEINTSFSYATSSTKSFLDSSNATKTSYSDNSNSIGGGVSTKAGGGIVMGIIPTANLGMEISGYAKKDYTSGVKAELSTSQREQLEELQKSIKSYSGSERAYDIFLFFKINFYNNSSENFSIPLPNIHIEGTNVQAKPEDMQNLRLPAKSSVIVSYRAKLSTASSLSLIENMKNGDVPTIQIEKSGLIILDSKRNNLAAKFINYRDASAKLSVYSNGVEEVLYINPKTKGENTKINDLIQALNKLYKQDNAFEYKNGYLCVFGNSTNPKDNKSTFVTIVLNDKIIDSQTNATLQLKAKDIIKIYAETEEFYEYIDTKVSLGKHEEIENLETSLDNFNIAEKYAKEGNVLAQCSLGSLYYKGKGVKQDHNKAFEYYKKSADQGQAEAIDMLKRF